MSSNVPDIYKYIAAGLSTSTAGYHLYTAAYRSLQQNSLTSPTCTLISTNNSIKHKQNYYVKTETAT